MAPPENPGEPANKQSLLGKKGTAKVGSTGRWQICMVLMLVLVVVLLCGSWSPLPSWASVLVLVIALVPSCALLLQLAIVKAAHLAVEAFDKDYLGVDVEIAQLSFNAFKGRFQVKGLLVHNPKGYSGDFLMKANNFVLDLDMRRTLASFGRTIEVSEVVGQGITASLEFDGYVYGKSNVTAVVDHLKEANRPKGDIQPVYNYWHTGNGEHTFHLEPAWPGEERLGCQFFAHATQAEGSEPVYDYWHSCLREHIFRLGDTPSSMEWRGNIHFYAFRSQVEHTEPVYSFWHVGNREHTLHFMPAWDREEVEDVQFYAYRKDPTSTAKEIAKSAELKPVYDFWHSGQRQHQYHFLPAWGGERKGVVQFYAYSSKVPGSQPVYDYYNKSTNKKSFHMGPPREGEERYSALFHVQTEPTRGMVPIYEFWHEANQEYNLHTGEPWKGEVRKEVMFYAFREDPSKDRKVFLRKVRLQKIEAKSTTRLMGASVKLDDMRYDDFSREFDASTPDTLVSNLLSELFSKVSVGLW